MRRTISSTACTCEADAHTSSTYSIECVCACPCVCLTVACNHSGHSDIPINAIAIFFAKYASVPLRLTCASCNFSSDNSYHASVLYDFLIHYLRFVCYVDLLNQMPSVKLKETKCFLDELGLSLCCCYMLLFIFIITIHFIGMFIIIIFSYYDHKRHRNFFEITFFFFSLFVFSFLINTPLPPSSFLTFMPYKREHDHKTNDIFFCFPSSFRSLSLSCALSLCIFNEEKRL